MVTHTVPPTIFTLIDKSLVQHLGDDYYGLHELLCQFAEQKLEEHAIEQAALRDRHVAYYLGGRDRRRWR
jgi:hypothetical protein